MSRPDLHDFDPANAEVDALKKEIENFKKEKDRVRAIVGRIGGVPTNNARHGYEHCLFCSCDWMFIGFPHRRRNFKTGDD